MKSYLSLIPISAKVRKRQNRMTMLCIIISVLLVTAIFSMADMGIRMEKKRVTEEHGSWHIMLKEPTEKQIDQIAQRTDVAAVSHYDALNVDLSDDYTIQGKTCVIAGGDHSILTEIYDDVMEGQYPAKENEIMLSNGAKELLSVNIGDVITMHTPAGDFDYRISGFGGDVTITTDADVVESRPYVERAFGRMYQSLPAEYEGKSGQIDLISYEEDQFRWAAEDLIAGDISDVAEGNGVLTVYDKSNSLKVGDTIRLEQTELTVAGVLEDSPFDTTDQPIVICSERMFTDITGEDAYAVLDVQLSSKASEQNVNELRALSDGHYDFYDRMAQNKDTQNTYFMFCLFVYGFLAVITLITVIHTVNSISMSVSARTKQYGAMRAVGMDDLQIKKMISMETATYTIFGLFAGCGLGLPLHYFFYTQMITDYWGTQWQLPSASVAGILALLVIVSLLAPFLPAKRICNMPITATINEL